MAVSVRFRMPNGDTAFSSFDRKRKKRIPANHDVTDCLPKLFEMSIVVVLVNDFFFFFFCDFSKNAENHFQKSGK